MRSASPLTKLPPSPSRAHLSSHVLSTVHMQGEQLGVQWLLYLFVILYSHVPGHVNVILLQEVPSQHKNCPGLT
jgi:hypothetical protein